MQKRKILHSLSPNTQLQTIIQLEQMRVVAWQIRYDGFTHENEIGILSATLLLKQMN